MNEWVERHRVAVVAALVLVDALTLIVSVVIALNQHHAIDKANDAAKSAKTAAHQSQHAVKEVKVRVCRNAQALIDTDKRQIQGINRQLVQLDREYIMSVLGVDRATAQSIINTQTIQLNQGKASAYRAIEDLSRNCA